MSFQQSTDHYSSQQTDFCQSTVKVPQTRGLFVGVPVYVSQMTTPKLLTGHLITIHSHWAGLFSRLTAVTQPPDYDAQSPDYDA